MSDFMQPEITAKQRGWRVETGDGTFFIPEDVHPVPHYFASGAHITSDDSIFEDLCNDLCDYIATHNDIDHIDVCIGYFARLSAPGYLDCTEWCCYKTLKEARDSLKEDY